MSFLRAWAKIRACVPVLRCIAALHLCCITPHRRGDSGSPGTQGYIFGQGFRIWAVTLVLGLAATSGAIAAERPVRIVALGDSLTAGFGVTAHDAFPAKLERALRAKNYSVEVLNAGVSGDTASGGLARLDWSIPADAEAVIVELGANDALRGIDPAVTRNALDGILRRMRERGIPVLLCGMRAPPNLGDDYARRFDAIFAELAAAYDTLFYPFFLEDVAAQAALNQGDGLHPTAAGVDVIVRGLLPKAEALIAKAMERRKS